VAHHGAEVVKVVAIEIVALAEPELGQADRIFRLAFGSFVGLADPLTFAGDADYVRTRWRADPGASLGAHLDGRLVGSNFASSWGSVATFGPLSVHPELWGRGIAQALLESTLGLFERWGTRHAGLFTFSSSPKHLALYQRYDFWPAFLTAILVAPTGRATEPRGSGAGGAGGRSSGPLRVSELSASDRDAALVECRALCEEILAGLDLSREIRAVAGDGLGDTLLVRDEDGALVGFAVCHSGAGTEAGSGATYVKFAASRPGRRAADDFNRLVDGCGQLAADLGTPRLVAGVNTARVEAYRSLVARGFRTEILGVAMQRGGEPGYNRPGVFVLDDWR
jgi:GNAT superfamily N-acetyltransferase